MTILQKLGRTLGGDSSALDSNGFYKMQHTYCEHCHCATLNAHNHKLDDQCQRMTELVRKVRC